MLLQIDRMHRLLNGHGLELQSPVAAGSYPSQSSGAAVLLAGQAVASTPANGSAAGGVTGWVSLASASGAEGAQHVNGRHFGLAPEQLPRQRWAAVAGRGPASLEQGVLGERGRGIEAFLEEWELEDAAGALAGLGVTTEARFRELLREEHVEELPLPPITRLAVLQLLRSCKATD